MRWITLFVLCGCGGDLLNNAAIHAHVDETPGAQPIGHATTSFELLVPIWGSYMMERGVYGSPRPSGIVFDWILGGLVPALLTGTSFAVHDADTRSVMRWSMLGLYAGTRAGVEIIGNLAMVRTEVGAPSGWSGPRLVHRRISAGTSAIASGAVSPRFVRSVTTRPVATTGQDAAPTRAGCRIAR